MLQFLGIHKWSPKIAQFLLDLHAVVGRPCNVNAYITSVGQRRSLAAHSDFQCALMVQLHGRKRWRLWKKPALWLPTRHRHIRGRDTGDVVDLERLGEPYLDVVLQPGDVLYVPRGCLHATATADGGGAALDTEPSLHLTVGMEAMMDKAVALTWEAALGAGVQHRHEHVVEGFYTALGQLINTDVALRRSVPASSLQEGDGSHGGREFKAEMRRLLHRVVDEMVDHTETVERVQGLMAAVQHNYHDEMRRFAGGA